MNNSTKRGAVLVETALVLPLFMLIFFGLIFEGSRVWFDKNVLMHAAREGARLAAVQPALQIDDPAVVNRVQGILDRGSMRTAQIRVRFVPPLTVNPLVRVQVVFNFQPVLTSRFPGMGDWRVPLSSEAQTRYEL